MGETIDLNAGDGRKTAAYQALPAGAAKATAKGAVVVIQEIFGVNGHIRSVADGFAADGYVAIAPALFDRARAGVELGYGPADIEQGRTLRSAVGDDAAMLDVAAAIAAARKFGRVGVVGYCWGGKLAWLAACRLKPDCAVGYYGGQIVQHVDETPACPTLLHFGDKDAGIPLSEVETIRSRHPEVPIHVYGGAGHGFNCDERGSWHAEAAATARVRTLDWLGRHLGRAD